MNAAHFSEISEKAVERFAHGQPSVPGYAQAIDQDEHDQAAAHGHRPRKAQPLRHAPRAAVCGRLVS
jgi:hypothetical protein